ncbi:proline-specific peptidase [Xylariaceae sp. FL0804]|nr:proline-specific peptidase [Xylariaceae sp. FL0804]
MAEPPARVTEGRAPFRIATVAEPCFTYYKIVGDLASGAPPVVVAHGGPGAGHEYLLGFGELWRRYGLPVVFYDQVGCAASTHLPRTIGDRNLWREQLFQDELDNLLDHLGLRASAGAGPGFHLLGQSWGGMLAAAFAARRPAGLRRLVLASALASKELSLRGTRLLRARMPPDAQRAFDEAEKTGSQDGPAYKDAMDVFYRKHLCRADPFPPPGLLPCLKNLAEDTTVNGPSPLIADGSMNEWTVIPRLSQITAPTLVYNGEYDTSHDIAQIPFFELIPRVRWVSIAGGGHMCHLEGEGRRERVLRLVGEFLTQKEVQ